MPATVPPSNQWTVRILFCPHCKWRAFWCVRKVDRYMECPRCYERAKVLPPRIKG
ncbi:MAG TPA: hypothetical protein VKA48_13010 [Gammaproteobacteria bacterium]|nr:hypothetical protein [Gammaproteobacteria bacterium]